MSTESTHYRGLRIGDVLFPLKGSGVDVQTITIEDLRLTLDGRIDVQILFKSGSVSNRRISPASLSEYRYDDGASPNVLRGLSDHSSPKKLPPPPMSPSQASSATTKQESGAISTEWVSVDEEKGTRISISALKRPDATEVTCVLTNGASDQRQLTSVAGVVDKEFFINVVTELFGHELIPATEIKNVVRMAEGKFAKQVRWSDEALNPKTTPSTVSAIGRHDESTVYLTMLENPGDGSKSSLIGKKISKQFFLDIVTDVLGYTIAPPGEELERAIPESTPEARCLEAGSKIYMATESESSSGIQFHAVIVNTLLDSFQRLPVVISFDDGRISHDTLSVDEIIGYYVFGDGAPIKLRRSSDDD